MRAEPIQARAIATRNELLAAARKLYADPEIGRDRITSAKVVAEAGKSIGTFYRYFDDEVDLMDAIYPDRDLPTMDQIERIARWSTSNPIADAGSNPREIMTFLEEAL